MAKSPDNSQTPDAGIEGQEPSQQIEVNATQAEEITATLAQMAQALREKAPANAQRASRLVSPDDQRAIDDLRAGLSDELIK